MGLAAYRRIGEDQGRPRTNDCADILQKVRIDRDTVCQILQIWRFSADASGRGPVAPAGGIGARVSRVDIRAGKGEQKSTGIRTQPA